MPEGDTVARTARVLHAALSGQTVLRFAARSVRLSQAGLVGRTVEAVESRGKHLLMRFTGGLILHTHLRMHGRWRVLPAGSRYPQSETTVAITTATCTVVGLSIPVAELLTERQLARSPVVALGPDLAAPSFNEAEALARIRARGAEPVGEVLLDQRVLAGVGNVLRSEVLFTRGIDPSAPATSLSEEALLGLVREARRQVCENARRRGPRRTTRMLDPAAGLWAYGRAGKPCRRCGTRVAMRRSGPYARFLYWCPRCQT